MNDFMIKIFDALENIPDWISWVLFFLFILLLIILMVGLGEIRGYIGS